MRAPYKSLYEPISWCIKRPVSENELGLSRPVLWGPNPFPVAGRRSSSSFGSEIEHEGIRYMDPMEGEGLGGDGGPGDLEESAASIEKKDFREGKRKRFHKALLNLYLPPSPSRSPPPRLPQVISLATSSLFRFSFSALANFDACSLNNCCRSANLCVLNFFFLSC